jgi:hypothetical protein
MERAIAILDHDQRMAPCADQPSRCAAEICCKWMQAQFDPARGFIGDVHPNQ